MYAITLTGEISLGSLAIVVSIVSTAVAIGLKLGTLQQLVRGHGSTLTDHAARLNRYEITLVEVGGNLQRMIGRIEATQDRIDRTTGKRNGEGGRP